jgi:hypothetical protein
MELFLGMFTADWERKRAAFLHDLLLGRRKPIEEDVRRRRGGGAPPGDTHRGSYTGVAAPSLWQRQAGSNVAERSMRRRFEGLATGSQPAVVKMASFGGAGRLGAVVNYISRNGAVAVENELGEEIRGRQALKTLVGGWEPTIKSRAESRDFATFRIEVGMHNPRSDTLEDVARRLVGRAVGDRSFAFAVSARPGGSGYDIEGLVVLRSPAGERLTGDAKATQIVQSRLLDSAPDFDRKTAFGSDIHFRFVQYGHGVDYGVSRLQSLVERYRGGVYGETGRAIADEKAAANLVQTEWRETLHSRKPRDVMHLIMSARAGTDVTAFHAAARQFLAQEFGAHRYVFSVHDSEKDPKLEEAGGRRPHVHVHAIIAMRSEQGSRVETSIQSFRGWREAMAQHARSQGIGMEMTDRRDRAGAASFGRSHVRPTSWTGRTEHEGTSHAGQRRYDANRSDERSIAQTDRSRAYSEKARKTWLDVIKEQSVQLAKDFAAVQYLRLDARHRNADRSEHKTVATINAGSPYRQILARVAETVSEGDDMRQVTRPEFEAYEKRVETALFQAGRTVPADERDSYEKIASAARDHVNARRELVEIWEEQKRTERQAARPGSDGGDRDGQQADTENSSKIRWADAVAVHGYEAVRQANHALLHIEIAREAIARARTAATSDQELHALKQGLANDVHRAAQLGASGNTLIREVAERDEALRHALQALEQERRSGRQLENTRKTGFESIDPAYPAVAGVERQQRDVEKQGIAAKHGPVTEAAGHTSNPKVGDAGKQGDPSRHEDRRPDEPKRDADRQDDHDRDG